jgi:hypothetical protein
MTREMWFLKTKKFVTGTKFKPGMNKSEEFI